MKRGWGVLTVAVLVGAAAGRSWADCAEAPPQLATLEIKRCRPVEGGVLLTARVLAAHPAADESDEEAPDEPETPTPSRAPMPATVRIYLEADSGDQVCKASAAAPKRELVLDTPCCDGDYAWCRYRVDFLGSEPEERFPEGEAGESEAPEGGASRGNAGAENGEP